LKKLVQHINSHKKITKFIIIFIQLNSNFDSKMEAPQPSLKMKLDALWLTNKPLFIALVAAIALLFLGSIFLIVYFAVLRPASAKVAT
jgi:hypothetical protein